jgi:cytoskeletal protein CcmA (bactofilin family)
MFKRWKNTTLTYLGSGSELNGDLKAEGSLRVDGTIRGTVEAQGDIEVSPGGSIEGMQIQGENILIYGCVKAKAIARGKLTLSRTARLEGDIVAGALEIESGAFYLGYIATQESNVLPGSQETDAPRLLHGRD